MDGPKGCLSRAISSITGKSEIEETSPPTLSEPTRKPGTHLSLRSQAPHLYPSRASFAASADPQAGSPLLTVLPVEIRQLIYAAMWRTGGYVHGIHIEHDRDRDCLESYPCILVREETLSAAGINAEVDAVFAAERAGGRRSRRRAEVRKELEEKAGRAERVHMRCHAEDAVCERRIAARFRTGADPLALWTPFLRVLLTCKRVYLESIDTIFATLTPIFPLDDTNMLHALAPLRFYHSPAHAFLSQDPHPSVQHLQRISLYSDHDLIRSPELAKRPRIPLPAALADLSGPAAAQWTCVLAALARLPALREVHLFVRFQPAAVYDLLPLARLAGPALAAKFVLDLPLDEDRDVPCRRCGARPGRFVLPPGNGGVAADEGCPPFGRVRRHELLRYMFEEWSTMADAMSMDRGLCYSCNGWCLPYPDDEEEEEEVGP